MKKHILFSISVFFFGLANAQVYSTSTGSVSFVSKTKFEEFSADNKQTQAAISTDKGTVQFKLPINSFQFEKDLMQTHFQENYMESATFPTSIFKGKIKNLADVKFSTDGTYDVQVAGTLEMHGVTKEIEVNGNIVVKGKTITLVSNFSIECSDYGIKIPKNNVSQVSNTINIKVNCALNPKKKK